MANLPFVEEQACIAPSPLPVSIIQNLQAIIERLTANNRLDSCKSIYVEVRSLNARASLQVLDLDYLEMSNSEFDYVQSIENYIDQWGKHLEFAVKHLFEVEYNLCNEVFETIELDFRMCCFAKIAAQSGILAFLRFGNNVTKSKKDPIKLLKLLDIFAVLHKLRLDFNRLFGGKACVEIQTLTRDLVKRIVDGACEIFLELFAQVELQRQTSPPSDGSVPRLVSFVTDYCNQLLGGNYRLTLTQVLVIHQSWKDEIYEEELLTNEVRNIINAIELNLEAWSKAYEDTTLSYIFMMNNHWHLYKNLKGTKLEELMGNSWLRRHEQCLEYYVAVYLRECWGRLPALLSQEGLVLFPGGRASARDLVKKRLKAFNEAFDNVYKKQSNWVVPDKSLREKLCQLLVHTIVPVYMSHLQNYGPLVEQDGSAAKYVKHTAQSMENMLNSLFQPRLGKFGSMKNTQLIGKIKNVVANQFRSTLTAV
ncbi:hypothetical protein L1049_004524 [Liquidambar formosana]|uniref:Exocyst subunit Exo70 family protein n=1 Tax=Liquidambar formosana TaxID=63359 RepID=A0AAP0WYB8_LIQFO